MEYTKKLSTALRQYLNKPIGTFDLFNGGRGSAITLIWSKAPQI